MKYSHFHGLDGQLIGSICYYKLENNKTEYCITKVSPKCERATRAEGRLNAMNSKRQAVVHHEFLQKFICKKDGSSEIQQFCALWDIATGEFLLPKHLKGRVQ